jgi:hypothetical protein
MRGDPRGFLLRTVNVGWHPSAAYVAPRRASTRLQESGPMAMPHDGCSIRSGLDIHTSKHSPSSRRPEAAASIPPLQTPSVGDAWTSEKELTIYKR